MTDDAFNVSRRKHRFAERPNKTQSPIDPECGSSHLSSPTPLSSSWCYANSGSHLCPPVSPMKGPSWNPNTTFPSLLFFSVVLALWGIGLAPGSVSQACGSGLTRYRGRSHQGDGQTCRFDPSSWIIWPFPTWEEDSYLWERMMDGPAPLFFLPITQPFKWLNES